MHSFNGTYNKNQTINFKLKTNSVKLKTVNIVGKKKLKYKNKGNPVVALIRNVIAQKENNHEHSLEFYEYDKYEKVEFALNNFSEKIVNNKLTKDFQFVFEHYVDTSEINSNPFIPFFFEKIYPKSITGNSLLLL